MRIRNTIRYRLLAVLLLLVTSEAAAEAPPDDRLLAHWTFDESGPAEPLFSRGGILGNVKPSSPVPRRIGVHGSALQLADGHALPTAAGITGGELPALSISAWVRPADLGSYKEILRQECDRRVLFSFQESGTILSLGLNVGGYVECDARVDPAAILDGRWHHGAATFDGGHMRVYLDGREIGSLNRPGRISVDPAVPFFIGSMGGTTEHFQGALDDLRVYAAALAPEQIASLHRQGAVILAERATQTDRLLDDLWPSRAGYARTLVECRRRMIEKRIDPLDDLTGAMVARLQSQFPREHEAFTRLMGLPAAEFLCSANTDSLIRRADHLVELMMEYRPLTDRQRTRMTDDDRRRWAEAEETQKQLERLKTAGDASLSPEWVEVLLQAGHRVQFRPAVSEPVAPYVRPHTPETRTLSSGEARESLHRDWLHQAGAAPTAERIRDEIRWARELAGRIATESGGVVEFADELNRLADVERRAAAVSAPEPAVYFAVREVKRAIALRNPAVDFNRILLVDMPYPQGSEWQHETRHRLGYMAVPGGRLLILEGLSPDGRLTQLMPQAPLHGSFWRPDLSWDATQVLFCFKPHNEKSFHLYRIDVDGTGLVQLTDGPYDDLDPVWLPDERHILFTTTRSHAYVRCMPPTNAFVMGRCDRDGRNIFLTSHSNEPEYLPSVLNDGRVIYTRWEYTDKPLWRAQSLWTVNPDGTQANTFWGNQSVWPDLLKDARSIPGSRRVMFTGSAHHDWFSGSVGIIDPVAGFNFPDGLTKVTADVAWPECGNGPVDPVESARYHRSGEYRAYYSPYPLSERDFLVSAQRNGKFVLYLMDTDGNRELIYEGVHNVLHAMPLKPRPRPPVIPDRVDWPDRVERQAPADGVIFSSDIYQNAPAELRGKARYLRVLQMDAKTYTYWHQRPYISTGPVISMVQSDGVKRILGTVPIEADGSVAFRAPAGVALHFQLLDEHLRALQTMRSFVGVMPGETRGCLGCHESHARAPARSGVAALTRAPSAITPPPWGLDTVSYPRYVQPVLDRYCGKCHQGEGEARKVLDLTDRPGFLGFSEPYVILIGHPGWGQPDPNPAPSNPGWGIADMLRVEAFGQTDPAGYRTPRPMTALSHKSRLIELASSGKHHDVRVDAVSLQRLIAWVDAMCPYNGDEEVRQIPDPVFQGVDWLAIRPQIRNAPRIVRPGPLD